MNLRRLQTWAWLWLVLTGWSGAAFAQDEGPSLITEMIGRAEAGETGPRTIEEAIDLARRTVFRLQRYGPDGVTFETIGGGFLVSADGLAITRASTLALQERCLALIQEGGIPLAVRTVAIDAAADLALIQLTMPDGGVAFPFIEAAEEPMPPDSSVWAVCFDGPRACRLDEAGGAELLPPALAEAAGAHWLAMTGSLGTGVCEPIINIKGQVVGLTTPLVDADTGVAYALAADHLRALLARRSEAPETDGGRSLPTLTVVDAVPAAALEQGVRALQHLAGQADRPLNGEALVGRADRWLPMLGAADGQDEALPAMLVNLTAALDALASRGEPALAAALQPICTRRLEASDIRPGQAILTAGEVLNPGFFDLSDEAGLLIQSGEHLILITDPRIPTGILAGPAPGSDLLAGGLFAGHIWRNDRPIAILQHGFARIIDR